MPSKPINVPETLARIVAGVNAGEVIFPSTAEMAMKIQRVLDDPDCSTDQLAHLIQADPLLASRVVAVANSVVYNRSGQAVSNIKNAVARIGFKTLRVIAASIVVRQMESMAETPEHARMARKLWERTTHVAVLAHLIARRLTRQDPDTAFFAGIVHDVGGLYLIARAGRYPGLLEGGAGSLEHWFEGGAAELGRAVLTRLNVPPNAMEAIEGLWRGELAIPPTSLGDTLLLATRLAPVDSPLDALAGEGRGNAPASLDMAVDADTLSGILEESKEEVASLIGALYG